MRKGKENEIIFGVRSKRKRDLEKTLLGNIWIDVGEKKEKRISR